MKNIKDYKVDYNDYIFSPGNTSRYNLAESSTVIYSRILPLIETLSSDAKFVDVGCGGAAMLRFINRYYPKISLYGVDISITAIEHAKKFSNNINLQVAPANHLPYPDNFFDALAVSEVLEHVPDIPEVLSEIYRVLKPQGKIYVTMPLEKSLFTLHGLLLKFFNISFSPEMTTHLQIIDREAIFNQLKKARFDINYISYSQHWMWEACMLAGKAYLKLSHKSIHSLYTPQARTQQSFFWKLGALLIKIPVVITNLESMILKFIPGLDIQITATKHN